MPTDYQYRCQYRHLFRVKKHSVAPGDILSCPYCGSDAIAHREIQWSSRDGFRRMDYSTGN